MLEEELLASRREVGCVRDSQVSSWNRPAKKRVRCVLPKRAMYANALCRWVDVGLWARGLGEGDKSTVCACGHESLSLDLGSLRPGSEVMFEFAAPRFSEGARRSIKHACGCTPRSEVSKSKLS